MVIPVGVFITEQHLIICKYSISLIRCLHGYRNGISLLRVGVYPVRRSHRFRFVEANNAAVVVLTCFSTCRYIVWGLQKAKD